MLLSEFRNGGRAAWVRFSSSGCCSAFEPESGFRAEPAEEQLDAAERSGITIFEDSRYLSYVREGTWAILDEPVRHWRIMTVDGTLHVASDQEPRFEWVAPGSRLIKPEVEVPG